MIEHTVRPDEAPTDGPGHGLLVRYRVMAFTTATLLIILVFVGIPLQVAAGRAEVVNDVGTIHGFFYLVYLYVAFQLTRELAIPRWQMALVLLAGTVPFCAFIAERKLTRRFNSRALPAPVATETTARGSVVALARRVRQRWLSRRALLLHLEVVIVAPGCALAGWWQATRALAGNSLSWVYSVEWPVFALLAIAGWWHLVHEDPERYRARTQRSADDEKAVAVHGINAAKVRVVEGASARLTTGLAVLVGIESALGMVILVFLPVGRPSGWLPGTWTAVYLAHAILGIPLSLGAVVLLGRVRRSTRVPRLIGWIGAVGVTMAAAAGLLTLERPLRVTGITLMLAGAAIAGFGYLIPTMEKGLAPATVPEDEGTAILAP
jgi:integral membrane protein